MEKAHQSRSWSKHTKQSTYKKKRLDKLGRLSLVSSVAGLRSAESDGDVEEEIDDGCGERESQRSPTYISSSALTIVPSFARASLPSLE